MICFVEYKEVTAEESTRTCLPLMWHGKFAIPLMSLVMTGLSSGGVATLAKEGKPPGFAGEAADV